MKNEVFKSDRHFTFFDYLVSHGQLLLRSDRRKGHEDNIDIIFYNTTFIQIFTMLYGIKISLVENNVINYQSVNKHLEYDGNNLFEIESNNEKYYLAASFVKIFSNNLEFSETSLGYDSKGREKQIAGFQ